LGGVEARFNGTPQWRAGAAILAVGVAMSRPIKHAPFCS
jgi:hypothetical protein